MKSLGLARSGDRLSILCLGAHSDDIEIGAGGTIISLIEAGVRLDVHWCVLSAAGERTNEARASAYAFLEGAHEGKVEVADFTDSDFPDQRSAIKAWLVELRKRTTPDVIFTHARHDAHQDHREVNQLTWNIFRDQLILEYEIPKWDGDLGQPNMYMPLSREVLERKIALLERHFGTQRSKDWFDRATFEGLSRLRGMECRAPEHHAEAFILRKARLL
ncbi:PIG-L deacetylase family protein [Mesorhizobium xinjiangense]|uniref:PIG-L deacetylase family protein n=1 Tax=Mesorhizobium xinjiangense TaxID=2678685 RepID=UPI0012ED919B|nr:PIG-L deacetylase family protein [Mesorhizobium xinjiangense]